MATWNPKGVFPLLWGWFAWPTGEFLAEVLLESVESPIIAISS